MKPLCIDLYCGLGGWAEGFLAEGYRVLGFDIERHDYGSGGYPGQLVLQDVTTLHGSQFKDAAVIVARRHARSRVTLRCHGSAPRPRFPTNCPPGGISRRAK